MLQNKIIVFFGQEPYKEFKGGIGSYINHRAFLLSEQGFEVWWCNEWEYVKFNNEKGYWENPILYPVQNKFKTILGKVFIKHTNYWENIEKVIKADIVEFPDDLSIIIPNNRKIKIIIQCHTSYLVRYFLNKTPQNIFSKTYHWLKKSLLNYSFKHVNGILACSYEIALLEAGFFKVHPDNFLILPHYFSLTAEPEIKKNECEHGNYFLVVGNFEYFKGFELVLSAFKKYSQTGGKCGLKFAGNKGWNDEKFEKEWSKNPTIVDFMKSEAYNYVNFYGTLGKKELSKLRDKATAVIVASRFEAFTMVAGECFLSGIPLILSNRTGWVRLVERFQAAILVDVYNNTDFANAMFKMETAKNRELYTANGNKLAKYITGNELAEKTVSFYRNKITEEVCIKN